MALTRVRRTTLAAASLALAGLVAPVAAVSADADRAHQHGHGHGGSPSHLALPDGFQPEGITSDGKKTAYLGSRADGDLFRLDLRTGKGKVFSQGPGTPSLGLKVDRFDRLFVAGGTGGDARVVDARSGKVLASYPLVSGNAFINDVVLTERAAYVTDSANAQVFAIPLGKKGALPAASAVRRIPLTGDWVQGASTSANGIVTSPDQKALLVVNSSNGVLYRVDPATGVARTVDTGGYALTNGDGLLREGRTLYVVQNRLNKVAVLELDRTGTKATLERTITSPDFDVPTTVTRADGALYLPNARFTTTPTPTTEYWVTRVTDGSKHHR